jgi:hypothetical protein
MTCIYAIIAEKFENHDTGEAVPKGSGTDQPLLPPPPAGDGGAPG